MRRLLVTLALLALAVPAPAQFGAQSPPAGGLVYLDSKAPFTDQQRLALESLFRLFPPRFTFSHVFVTQVPASAWRYGKWRGWTDESGNVNLKQTEWLGVRGLALHELAHAYHYRFLTPAEWDEWSAFWAKHPGECGTDYKRVARNADEGFSELIVCLLRPGLPGYGRPSPAAAALGRRLLH